MISLFTEKWLPIRRIDGRLDWISPEQLSEPDISGFAANRADFNGALAQLAVGLLQTATPVSDEAAWARLLDTPPGRDTLAQWFAPLADAFVVDGAGPRFMQDLTLKEGAVFGIGALLIDAAGGSTVVKNADLFVKRGTVSALCPHCTALALFTLQTNAPAGGAGQRTSLRGGGPLTTLIATSPARSLWHDLWLNVLPQRVFLERGGDAAKTARYATFPWLAETGAIQAAGGETQPLQVHPHHVYWAMPRRIRLDVENTEAGRCDLCKRESDQLIRQYATKPQGLNYKGAWRHPLSPYYETKEGWLPVHPQPGGFSYRYWLAWSMGVDSAKKVIQPAANVAYALSEERLTRRELRLWAFGYDMDNMKARCWYETIFPLYELGDCAPRAQREFRTLVVSLIEAAELSVFYLRQAVRQAWFGDGDIRGDLGFVDKMFWDSTDAAFQQHLRELTTQSTLPAGIGRIDEEFAQAHALRWQQALRKKALRLFDVDIVGAGPIAQQDPHRIAQAYKGLKWNLDGKALRAVLAMPQPEGEAASSKLGRKAKKSLS